jgi:hypothetical protein
MQGAWVVVPIHFRPEDLPFRTENRDNLFRWEPFSFHSATAS